MRIPIFALSLIAAVATASAQPSGAAENTMSPREIAIDNLLSERDSPAKFEVAVKAARDQGVGEQAILEARFLYHVDLGEDDKIAAMLPEFLERRDVFELKDSAIFAVKEDWLAVVEYVQAIDSLKKGETASFKQHITEAFWLSPRQASAFAPHIERLRLNEAMRQVRIDFTAKLLPLAAGDAVSLESLIAGRKAMLFHFWSPWSRECEAGMPDFVATAMMLESKGVAVVSLLPDDSPKLLTDARKSIHPLGAKPPGAWLLDRKGNPFTRELRVQTLPVMVLVSPDGKILFNGEPTDDAFWQALRKVDEAIVRPQSPLENAE